MLNGWGLPAAIGAFMPEEKNKQYYLFNEKVDCKWIYKNLQSNAQQIPLKIFIFNNGGYLTIKQTQILGFKGRIMGADKKVAYLFQITIKLLII